MRGEGTNQIRWQRAQRLCFRGELVVSIHNTDYFTYNTRIQIQGRARARGYLAPGFRESSALGGLSGLRTLVDVPSGERVHPHNVLLQPLLVLSLIHI